jgi:hypothetical protein
VEPCLFLFLTTSTYGSDNLTAACRRMERAKLGFLRVKPACFAVRVNQSTAGTVSQGHGSPRDPATSDLSVFCLTPYAASARLTG